MSVNRKDMYRNMTDLANNVTVFTYIASALRYG